MRPSRPPPPASLFTAGVITPNCEAVIPRLRGLGPGNSPLVPTEDEKVEDEFRSLLEGLRTTLPGVQLATAFLLTVPMYDKYDTLAHNERVAYYLAFSSALISSLLLTAPSSHQRLRNRQGHGLARQNRRHLDAAVKITVVGSALFAVTITAVAFLVASVVLTTTVAVAMTVVVALTCLWSWYYLPLVSFRRDD